MEMHQVRYFLAVADLLNFTKAANSCNVSQPSLTRAIKLLEEEFGGQLFHRERANTHLTELGRTVRPHLQQVYDKAHTAKQLAKDLKSKGMGEKVIETQLDNPDKYTFFVPEEARWSTIRHLKTNVGTALNKALEALEDANVDALQDVLKGINFNRKIGQRTLDDDTLSNFIQNFEKIPLRDENFEFPDLLGAAYEYFIKFFADSAGKKAGEFYTPADVVRTLVEIVDPQPGMSVYDATCGSGGMLIQTRDYVRECGGDPRTRLIELGVVEVPAAAKREVRHGVGEASRPGDVAGGVWILLGPDRVDVDVVGRSPLAEGHLALTHAGQRPPELEDDAVGPG